MATRDKKDRDVAAAPAASESLRGGESAPGDAVPPEAPIDFEHALGELEQLVDQMEGGEMSLEASLAAFERGVHLTRLCQAALRNAELKVRQLTRENTLEELALDDADDD